MAASGINKADFFLKLAPEKRASPPIGAKFGAWGIKRVATANNIINNLLISIRFYPPLLIDNCLLPLRPFYHLQKMPSILF